MRIALFARVNTDLNPYVLLYKQALERRGLIVRLEQEFNLKWLVTRGESCDAIHLHWIEAAYKPSSKGVRSSGLARKLLRNSLSKALRGLLKLTNFSAALLLARLQGKWIVYTVHNLTYGGRFWPFAILNRIAHYIILSLADRIHAHNRYTLEVLGDSYKRKDGVAVVPHGNYIGCYPNRISRQEARQHLRLPDDAFVYLFLGLLRPHKGVKGLIESFDRLGSSANRLLIVGRMADDDYGEEILRLSQKNPAIRLVPEFVPDEAIQLYMNACDVCVLPYENTTTSGAAMLALSFGRPIIVPAIASFPELVTPEIGVLYDPSQPDGLVSALQQAGRRSWSEAEILDFAHRFDWDRLGPRLAALYQSADSGGQQ